MGTLSINMNQMPAYRDEHLSMDFDQQAVVLDSQRMILTRKEYDLLALLVQHAGEIIPREALLMRVWATAPKSAPAPSTSMCAVCAKSSAPMPTSTSRPS